MTEIPRPVKVLRQSKEHLPTERQEIVDSQMTDSLNNGKKILYQEFEETKAGQPQSQIQFTFVQNLAQAMQCP